MTEKEILTKLFVELGMFVQVTAPGHAANRLLAYDPEAREIIDVKLRENCDRVINYRDQWGNNLIFVIKLTA